MCEVLGISGFHCGVDAVFRVVNVAYVGSSLVFLDSLSVQSSRSKTHPLQAMKAQRGLGELRLLDFLTTALCGGRLSALRTGRLYPHGYSWYSFSVFKGWEIIYGVLAP